MSLWSKLKSALGGGAAGQSDTDREGLYLYVRCDRCADVVRVRISMANELQQEFSDAGSVSGYSVQKGVVDGKCFVPITVRLTFDSSRRELHREIQGGQFVDREVYEASRL